MACRVAEVAEPRGIIPRAQRDFGARRISVSELKDLIAKNQAVVIDVRNEASYNAGHIHGAKLIPETEIPNHLNELPKDKLIVTYCS